MGTILKKFIIFLALHLSQKYFQNLILSLFYFHGFCLDEGAPQSITGLLKWLAYLHTYHLLKYLFEIRLLNTSVTFGEKRLEKSRSPLLESLL